MLETKLKLLLRSALKALLVGISLYIHLTRFCPTEEKNHQFIAFSKYMYIQIALLSREVKDTALS